MLGIFGNGFEHIRDKGEYHIFIDTVLCGAELSNWDFAVLGTGISEQTPFDIEMRFTMNKLLSCRYNMDTNRVEARFADGSTVAIDCIAIEDE